VCADLTEDAGEVGGVVIAERGEEESTDGLDMPGKYCLEYVAARSGDGDDGAALIVGRGGSGDQAPLLKQLCLIGQAAAAVDDAVGEVGHAQVAVDGVAQAGQELELDVTEGPGIAELFLDRGAQEAAHLREREVRAQLCRRQGSRLFRHSPIIGVASSSKRCTLVTSASKSKHSAKGKTVKAIQFQEVGGPEVLQYSEIEQPAPAMGEVRLRVAASAFSAADNSMRAGFLPIPIELPHVPGYDVSGTIDAIGEGVDGLTAGDPVIAFLPMERDGGAAEYVVAPADAVVAAPTSIPLADAAALPSVALTAWQALFDEGELQAGQRVLIVGAGGVVGKYAIQLAKRAGVRVVATASPRSLEAVRAAGADQIIDHTDTDLLGALDGQVDVLLNLAPIDPEQFSSYVAAVRDGGMVVSTTAFMATPGDATRGVAAKTVFVLRNQDRLAQLVSLVDDGALTVEVTRRITLPELPALHTEASAGHVPGKVIVIPA
jgi:NADPH:quinone reductase-like Zn-dependent oxidoreductase